MGYQRHNAIVVTSWKDDLIEAAHKQATAMFEWVSELSKKSTNNYRSFFIPPDGSKEGWAESDCGDKVRAAFMDWCKAQEYEDGSNSLCAVDVSFSGDGDAKVDREI